MGDEAVAEGLEGFAGGKHRSRIPEGAVKRCPNECRGAHAVEWLHSSSMYRTTILREFARSVLQHVQPCYIGSKAKVWKFGHLFLLWSGWSSPVGLLEPPRCGTRQDPSAYGLAECGLGVDT